jgi:glutathione S-transferase
MLSFEGMYSGLGSANMERTLAEAKVKGHKSLKILQKKLEREEWLVLGRPTIADIAVFAYVALAPMGDVSLAPYPAVKSWIERMRNLPHFILIKGLDDPMYRRMNAEIRKVS